MKILQSVLLASFHTAQAFSKSPSSLHTTVRKMSALSAKPFAVVVEAEIKEERMDEFMELIKKNAEETRKEPGCIRFDVLRSQSNPNQFFFYELYENVEAIDHHKKQAHYNLWADFKGSGGTVSSVSHKTDGEFLT